MFSNLLHLISRDQSTSGDAVFVRDVQVRHTPRPRSRRMELLLIIGWALIVVKSVVVIWAIKKYAVPIHPLWVIGPTVAFALLCTGVYFWRND